MKTVSLDANAKINLFLDVTSIRDDGYHNIESVMQTLSLADKVSVSCETADTIEIHQFFENSDLPCDNTNLCYKAAMAYLDYFKIDRVRISINVTKNIPYCAGLAGGSADAAAVIMALDLLFCNKSTLETLSEIGLFVGSDVPFCIYKGTCEVRGRGEIVKRLSDLPEYTVLVAKSQGESVSTRDAFARIDNNIEKSGKSVSFDDYVESVNSGNRSIIESGTYNVFEKIMADTLPKTLDLIELIKKNGASATLMSGSGPSVFGLFYDRISAEKVAEILKNEYFACVCGTV